MVSEKNTNIQWVNVNEDHTATGIGRKNETEFEILTLLLRIDWASQI